MNTMNIRIVLLGLLASLGSVTSLAQSTEQSEPAKAYPEVPFVATPENVVDKMLDLAKVTKRDVVYDLGSGDGRIVIAAAKRGAHAVGVDIDPDRIKEGLDNAKTAGVTERTKFINEDLFKADLSEATVVTMYLLPSVNQRLRPKLLRELAPGTRIVSHAFDMNGWEPEKTVEVNGNTVYYWIVPKRDEALKMAAAFEKEASER
jgi:SAM-dependent methyltransferase